MAHITLKDAKRLAGDSLAFLATYHATREGALRSFSWPATLGTLRVERRGKGAPRITYYPCRTVLS